MNLNAKKTIPDSQPVSDKNEEDIVVSLGLKVFISDNFMSMFYFNRNAQVTHVKNPGQIENKQFSKFETIRSNLY